MEKNNTEAKTKRITIDAKYEKLEKKLNELLNKINCNKIKTVSEAYYQELLDFLDSYNIMIVKKEDGNYCMKNGERGKKTKNLSEEMIQGLKLLGYYTKQDYEERDIVNSIVDDMQKILNEEKNISKKYEILEVNNFSDNPNEISVTVIDNSGNIIENVILPIVFTKYINQNKNYINKTELQILFSLQDRLDGILNKLLKDIENEYRNNPETMSFRDKLLNEDFTQKEIINNVLNELREKREKFEQEIKNYKLIRQDDGIYLKCHNVSLKLPDTMVTKLQLLGFYDEKENSLIEEVINKTLHTLTISEFYHYNNYLTPEDCYISKISTMGDLSSNQENGEKISSLDGLAVYVDHIEKEKMFKGKDEKERKKTTVLLPYEFTKMVTQNSKDAFGTEMDILRSINEVFLQNTQFCEVNSKMINKVLNDKGIRLKKKIIDEGIQFTAKKDNQEVLIDRIISQNILEYMKSETKSIATEKYSNNEKDLQIEEEFGEDLNEREHVEYLLKTYKFLEELNKRGYISKGGISTEITEKNKTYKFLEELNKISTKITEKNKTYGRKPLPNKIVLDLPYGIGEDLSEINEIFDQLIQEGQYVDPSELLVMMTCIQKNDGHKSNFEKYKKILINAKRMVNGKQSIINGFNYIKELFTRIPIRYTAQKKPTRDFEQLGLVPRIPYSTQQEDNDDIIVEVEK